MKWIIGLVMMGSLFVRGVSRKQKRKQREENEQRKRQVEINAMEFDEEVE